MPRLDTKRFRKARNSLFAATPINGIPANIMDINLRSYDLVVSEFL